MKKEQELLENFFNNRNMLIDKLEKSEIDKTEFIVKCLDFFNDNNLEPFSKIINYEQGMFNYQYYNMWAKYYYMEAQSSAKSEETEKYTQSYLDEGYYYYSQKEKSTFELLKVIKYKNIEAYYIDLESKSLNGTLFEISLNDYDRALLHSKSFKLKELLDSKKIFKTGMKKSAINDYVNSKYSEEY